jgi:hypothetical protein
MTGLSVTEHGSSATGFVIAGAGAPRPTSRFRRPMRALQLLLYLAFLAVLVESAAALLAKLPSTRTVFFSGEAAFVDQLRSMERFYPRLVADRYDGVLGWDNPRATALVKHVCAGHTVTETYLEDCSRKTPDAADGRAILAVGDSFTLGAEVDDDDSYPAQLSRLLDRKVIDYGVGGYCPLQAVLKFRQRAADYPEARAVVLGITSEDIPRMLIPIDRRSTYTRPACSAQALHARRPGAGQPERAHAGVLRRLGRASAPRPSGGLLSAAGSPLSLFP